MRQAGTARPRNVPHSVKQWRDQPGQERFRMPDLSVSKYATSRPKEKKQLTELQDGREGLRIVLLQTTGDEARA